MQTTYTQDPDDGFAGMLAHGHSLRSSVSRALEDAAGLGFGLGVTFGTDPQKQFTKFGSGATLEGVTVHKHDKQDPGLAGALGITQDETATLIREGELWVFVEGTILVTDDVFCRHTAGGGGSVIGAFRKDADTATADNITGVSWLQGTTTAGIALLQLNLPQ